MHLIHGCCSRSAAAASAAAAAAAGLLMLLHQLRNGRWLPTEQRRGQRGVWRGRATAVDGGGHERVSVRVSHTSHVTCYTSHVTRHMLHVTRHTSHVTQCDDAARCASERELHLWPSARRFRPMPVGPLAEAAAGGADCEGAVAVLLAAIFAARGAG